jgi:hypothetical protein
MDNLNSSESIAVSVPFIDRKIEEPPKLLRVAVRAHDKPGGLQFSMPPAPGSASPAAYRLRHVT